MSKVIILKCDEKNIAVNVNKMFTLAGGIDRFVKEGDKVLIKPNFLSPKKSSSGVTTDLRIIEAVVRAVLRQRAIPILGEGSPISFDTDKTFQRLGVDRLAEKYDVKLVDFNRQGFRNVKIGHSLVLKEVKVSNTVFEVDKIINLAKLKTHTQTTISLGMKNLMGCLSGEEKLRLHRVGLSKGVVDINQVIKPAFTIIDCIVCMEGAGPSNGKVKRMNLLLGSDDILALEVVGAEIMGFNPNSIQHIVLARSKGIGEHVIEKIEIVGQSIGSVRKKFSFPRFSLSRVFGDKLIGVAHSLRGFIDLESLAKKIYEYAMPYPFFIDSCTRCNNCVINCPEKALVLGKIKPLLDRKKCIKCYVCDEVCLYGKVNVKGRR